MTATAMPRPDQPTDGRELRVVLVDDTPDIRLLMRIALEQLGGFSVVGEAGDGVAAIREVGQARPDVIVLDLAMPRMGGLEALPRLRELCPAATILVLSGFEDESLGPVARRAGADGYIRKGSSPQEIVARIHSLRTGSAPPATPRATAPPRAGIPPLLDASVGPAPDSLGLPTDVVRQAPFAVLVAVTDQRGDRWVSAANDAAQSLCGPVVAHLPVRLAALGEPIDAAAGQLAGASAAGASTVSTVIAGTPVSVWLSGAGKRFTLLVTPEPANASGQDEADRLRRVVAAAVHELRNPVTVIIGATQTLGTGRYELPAEVRDRLFDAIERQARALERSTTDLLAASRAQAGRLTVDVRVVPLDPLLRAAAADWADGGEVTIDAPDDLMVLADPGRLEQMLANLLSNAGKYGTPPVTIAVRTTETTARIDIRDCGPGVSPAFVPHLFEEFSRQPGTQVQGTGLGLYVVRSLARAQGGAVGYEHLDGRSTFWVTVPLVPADLGAAS